MENTFRASHGKVLFFFGFLLNVYVKPKTIHLSENFFNEGKNIKKLKKCSVYIKTPVVLKKVRQLFEMHIKRSSH